MKSQNAYYGAVAAVVVVGIIMLALIFLNVNPTAAPSTAPTAPASGGASTAPTTAPSTGDAEYTTTASGLQYRVLTQGNGPRPTAADTVTVHYRGTLTDGTQFDSSYDRGQPATFPLSGVIAGWTEGVQLMPVGSTFEFIIPPDLGYGAAGNPPVIPPNAPLIFTIELLGIQ